MRCDVAHTALAPSINHPDTEPPSPSLRAQEQAKRVPFDGLRWMHLDSHPDLTLPPRLTPATVMDPPALYEAIECVFCICMCLTSSGVMHPVFVNNSDLHAYAHGRCT